MPTYTFVQCRKQPFAPAQSDDSVDKVKIWKLSIETFNAYIHSVYQICTNL